MVFEKTIYKNSIKDESKKVSTYVLISGSLNELFKEPRIKKKRRIAKKSNSKMFYRKSKKKLKSSLKERGHECPKIKTWKIAFEYLSVQLLTINVYFRH